MARATIRNLYIRGLGSDVGSYKLALQAFALRHLSWRVVLGTILNALGALWIVIESTSFFSQKFAAVARCYWWSFAVAGVVAGLWRAWPRLAVRAPVFGTDASIEIRVADLFSQEGAVVVGSSTTFDTSMDDGTISAKSVQGQYTKLYADSVEDLDRQITDSLIGIASTELHFRAKPYGKRLRFPVGTVASVKCNQKRAYFVAIATFNQHKVALAKTEDILDALPLLWEFVRNRGGLDPISIPVLGSGFSRVQAKREELIREIVRSFVAASRTGRFCERLTISVAAQDYQEGHIDLPGLGRFLEHECKYAGTLYSSTTMPTGTPAES